MAQFPAVLRLADLNGTNGFQITGESENTSYYLVVTSAGDMNGDGFDDVAIGIDFTAANGFRSGASYVVFGGGGAFAPEIALATLDGSDGFQISGVAASDYSGRSLSGAGDINGDGFDDLIVGAASADPNGVGSGASYVVFGKASGFAANLELSSLNGANGFRLSGLAAGDAAGYSVSGAGDLNGDGFDDLIVGAVGLDDPGLEAGGGYVVFGRAGGFPAEVLLSGLDGTNGFKLVGETAGGFAGRTVASAGDVNGDGVVDLLIGAPSSDTAFANAGTSYVVFGRRDGFAATVDLAALNGADGFRLTGAAADDFSGIALASAGDVNGDGYADIIIGASSADPNGSLSGAAYVVFGKAGGFAPTMSLGTLNGGDGFSISGQASNARLGKTVSGAGDVNGDGFDDILVSSYLASYAGAFGAGETYVIFGKAGGFTADLNPLRLNGNDGYRIVGEAAYDFSGRSVSAAGDVNGDGLDDLIVGARLAAPYLGAGYVVFGSLPGEAVDRTGSVIAQAIHGSGDDDRLSGLGGADTLTGYGGDDTLLGGGGLDKLLGGSGDDELQGGGGGDQLDSFSGDDRLYGGSGADRLDGGVGNDLFDGGSGDDTASYALASAAVTVSLATFGWQFTGGSGFDSLWNIEGLIGSRFNDRLSGGVFDDDLSGGLGNDTLAGADGADTLTGGRGGDELTGGAGSDRFVYAALNESQGTGAGADRITDLAAGDIIDLSRIDADATAPGNQAFVLQASFTGLPRQLVLTYQAGSDRTLLRGDVTGDGVADFTVILLGGDFIQFTGFVL